MRFSVLGGFCWCVVCFDSFWSDEWKCSVQCCDSLLFNTHTHIPYTNELLCERCWCRMSSTLFRRGTEWNGRLHSCRIYIVDGRHIHVGFVLVWCGTFAITIEGWKSMFRSIWSLYSNHSIPADAANTIIACIRVEKLVNPNKSDASLAIFRRNSDNIWMWEYNSVRFGIEWEL